MIREKQKIKEDYRKEIQKQVIDRGEIKSKVLDTDLHDLHGDYISKQPYVGTLGGQLMQVYFVLETIKGIYTDGLDEYNARLKENDKDDYLQKPNHPAEIMVSNHLRIFLYQYLKEMKNDSLHIVLHEDVAKWLENNLVTLAELHKMTEEQKEDFRKLFVEKRGHSAFKNTDPLMDELLGFIADICFKKAIEGAPIKTD